MTAEPSSQDDLDRASFDRALRRIIGVLEVTDHVDPHGHVTVRVVAGYGERIGEAVRLLAPDGLKVTVREDHSVTALPAHPGPDARTASQIVVAENARRDAQARANIRRHLDDPDPVLHLRCDLCGHRTIPVEVGLNSKCRKLIFTKRGSFRCSGRYRAAPPPRRRWWGGVG